MVSAGIVGETVAKTAAIPAPPVRSDNTASFRTDPDMYVCRHLFVDGDDCIFALDHERGLALVKLDSISRTNEKVVELVELLIARSIDIRDSSRLTDLQLREWKHRAFYHFGLLFTALSLGNRHAMRTFPRVAEQGADAVHQIGIENVLELAGPFFELHPEDIVNKPFGKTVGANQAAGVVFPFRCQADRFILPFDDAFRFQFIDNFLTEILSQLLPEKSVRPVLIFFHVPEDFQVFFFEMFLVHTPHAPTRRNRRIQRRIPARIKEEMFMITVISRPVFTPTCRHMATILAKQGTNMVVMTTAVIVCT